MTFNKTMLKIIVASSTIACTFAHNIYASSGYENDYDSNIYQDEGRLLLKLRGSFLNTDGKMKTSAATSNQAKTFGAKKFDKFISTGVGGEASATLFFTNNVASEIGLGLTTYRHKTSPMTAAAFNYSDKGTAFKRARLYMIPLTWTLQYHVAPFGGIRPYVGGGYQFAYIHSNSKNFTVSNAHGPVIQVGLDMVLLDDTIVNLDIKKSMYSSKITYKKSMLRQGGDDTRISSKYKIDPLQISVGIGMKF